METCGFCGLEADGDLEDDPHHQLCLAMDMAHWNLSFGIVPTREEYGELFDFVWSALGLDEGDEDRSPHDIVL